MALWKILTINCSCLISAKSLQLWMTKKYSWKHLSLSKKQLSTLLLLLCWNSLNTRFSNDCKFWSTRNKYFIVDIHNNRGFRIFCSIANCYYYKKSEFWAGVGTRKSWLTLKPSLKWFTLTIVSFYCFYSLFSRPPHFCLPRSRLQGHMNFVDKFIHKNWYKNYRAKKTKIWF